MKRLTWILTVSLAVVGGAMLEPAQAQESAQVQDSAAVANDPSQMLPSEIEARFKAIRFDPDPEQLVRDAHYWVSNENAHYVWYNEIKDRGGVLSGVGTDQVYLLAGWANSSIVLPMDFDRQIRNLHIAYGAAFMAASNIDEFRSYWKRDNADKMKAALEKYFPSEVDAAMKAWKSGCREVNGRFTRVIKKYSKNSKTSAAAGIPTFLTDETQYNRIRQLWLNHRVIPICGDLTGNNSMIDIAKALRDSGLKLTILYPSNAELFTLLIW